MARRGKPQGNKRQREMAKARKKREKEARKVQRTGGAPDEGVEFDIDGFPILPEPEVAEGAPEGTPGEAGEAGEAAEDGTAVAADEAAAGGEETSVGDKPPIA